MVSDGTKVLELFVYRFWQHLGARSVTSALPGAKTLRWRSRSKAPTFPVHPTTCDTCKLTSPWQPRLQNTRTGSS